VCVFASQNEYPSSRIRGKWLVGAYKPEKKASLKAKGKQGILGFDAPPVFLAVR
jgi:hypothetical protein